MGLAAPQIGVGLRAFCMDVTGHLKARSCHGLVVLLDPVILERDDDDVTREGCMSLPDFTGNVRRASRVTVEGVTPGGEHRRIEADAFEARAVQHEVDHLHGVLFIDKVTENQLFSISEYRRLRRERMKDSD